MAHHTRFAGKSKAVTFRIPVCIDLERLPAGVRDYASFLLNTVSLKVVRWQCDADGWVNLKHDYLTAFLPRRIWPRLRDEMIGLGMIEFDHHYIVGQKCYSYRVPNPFQPTRPVPCTNSGILRKLAKIRRALDRTLLPVDTWLWSHFHTLNFDEAKSQEVIETLAPRVESTLGIESYRAVTRESAARFADGDRYYLKCDFNRRHTPLTNLPKRLRCCLSVEGEPLVGVDLRNSQPIFAGLAAVAEYSKRGCGKDTNGTGRGDSSPITTALLPEAESATEVTKRIPGDLRDYLDVCQSGKFYESLMRPNDDRDAFKQTVFRDVFYGPDGRPSELRTRFSTRWPSMAGWLRRLKATDYRRAAHEMQRAESRLFIDVACDRIRRDRPDVPVFTLHDSLASTFGHVSYLQDVLANEFERLGVRPTLTVEKFGSN